MPSCGLWLAEDGVGKVVPRSVRLIADVPEVQKLLDAHNRTHHPMPFLDPVRKAMSIFPVRVTAHAPCMQLRQDMLRTCTHETMPIICLRLPLGHLLLRGLRKRGDGPEAATKPTIQQMCFPSLHVARRGALLFHNPCPLELRSRYLQTTRTDSQQWMEDGGVAPSESHGVEASKIEQKNGEHFLGEKTVA